MNQALLSSKNMCWCTPSSFFEELNKEFHFTIDAAATESSAKCAKYFTPETDGLLQRWAGGQSSVILLTEGRSASGCAKLMKSLN